MSGESQTATSRWKRDSIHLGNLAGASSDQHYWLHLAAIEHELSAPITIEKAEDILSRKHWSERLQPFRHQVQNLMTFCRRAPVALFADDVGLGKTISAGLVLNELQTRKKVRRALILCPKMLLQQWQDELKEKFGIHAAQATGAALNQFLVHEVPVVISTYESARDRMDKIRAASFDMLILDEAHRLRNLHGSTQSPQLATAIHGALKNRDFKYVLMLTATPIQNRLWDIYSLVDCLSVAKGHANPLGSPSEFVSRFVADSNSGARTLRVGTREEFRRKVQEYMVRTSRGEAGLVFPARKVVAIQCDASPAERVLQKLVGGAMVGLNALARTSLAEALMSSPRALLTQARSMRQHNTLPPALVDGFERGVADAGSGCKLPKLLEILQALRSKNTDKWRAIVFTRRLETLELISEELRARGIRSGTIKGSGAAANQASIRAFTADPPQAHVLVSTDAGAVGLNLQVCNVVINFDLPWNPMVLEQRIGRVQRLGSKFGSIEVLNLTVKDSIEDLIVARLVLKLQAISETIGDIEAILEASTYDDDDRFEETLKDLVARALMGQNVEEAMRRAQQSIDDAKRIYDQERDQVEATLGGMEHMHTAGPSVPRLTPRSPRYDVPTFCRKAFACDGAHVEELSAQRLRVVQPGHAPWMVTFDDTDPDLHRVGAGVFGGTSVKLYQEGSKAFERLLGEWRKRHSHRVLDRSRESRAAIQGVVQSWADGLGVGVTADSWAILQEQSFFNGALEVRATASISHDRYEKLCVAHQEHPNHGTLRPPTGEGKSVESLAVSSLCPLASNLVMDAVESDSDVAEFIRFYDARKAEEIDKAARTGQQRQEVGKRFETALAADLVGATGHQYLTVDVRVKLKSPANGETYEADLTLVPLSGKILIEPEQTECEQTKRKVPRKWLKDCVVSNRRVLRHLLETSAMSGLTALSEYFGTCDESGRRLLKRELGECEITTKTVGTDLLVRSAVTGKRGLDREMGRCEFTDVRALPEELVKSDVSGRWVRKDLAVASSVSGVRGHRSEFRECEESHAYVLESEGARSDISGRFIRADRLVRSEKNPSRRGLDTETVRCSVSSKILLRDEAERSAVSQSWIDKDEVVYSAVSGKPARRDEVVICDVSGALLLPDETGTSSLSGRKVDRRLIANSEISGKPALESELRRCDFTGAKILPSEGVISDVSGMFIRSDQLVRSTVSGVQGHPREFVSCAVTKEPLLPTEAGLSALSGALVRLDLLSESEKAPRRQGLSDEFVRCEVSGRRLLRDEVAKSEVSGRIVDRELLVKSSLTGRLALEEEMTACAETGVRLLPDELAKCAVTGRLVAPQCLVASSLSGRRAISSEAAHCDFTQTLVLKDELLRSEASPKLGRKDQMATSDHSAKVAHLSELIRCELSGKLILLSESGRSSVGGKVVLRELLAASEKNPGRLGCPDEFVVCAATSKQLLKDEVAASDYSGRLADRDTLLLSAVSGRAGLPTEMLACEESHVPVLPDETEVCSITGKRLNRALIGVSEVTGKLGVARLLGRCPETSKRGFDSEFVTCTATGLRVVPTEVELCTVTNELVLRRQMVKCQVSGRWLRRDRAEASSKSARLAHPECVAQCPWSGRRLLVDELRKCAITGLDFDSDLVKEGALAAPLSSLLETGIPSQIMDTPQAASVEQLLFAGGFTLRGLAIRTAPESPVIAFLADCSSLFGWKKRHVLGFATSDGDLRFLSPPSVGVFQDGSWLPELLR